MIEREEGELKSEEPHLPGPREDEGVSARSGTQGEQTVVELRSTAINTLTQWLRQAGYDKAYIQAFRDNPNTLSREVADRYLAGVELHPPQSPLPAKNSNQTE